MRLLSAAGPGNLVYEEGGRLFNWVHGSEPEPFPWAGGPEAYVEASEAKHNVRPIVGPDGTERPDYHGRDFPDLVRGERGGRPVFFLSESPAR